MIIKNVSIALFVDPAQKKIVNNAHILYIIEKDTLGGGRVRDRDDGDDGDVSMECWKVLLFLYSKGTRI